tara:strand:- start:20 stop:292 length:273 start_codon:yes stop_codon:yes gene_type:complete
MQNLTEIYKITAAARQLAELHHDMTIQVISDEYSILCYECDVLKDKNILSPCKDIEGNMRLLKAIEECELAMNMAQDALDFHYSKFPTNL